MGDELQVIKDAAGAAADWLESLASYVRQIHAGTTAVDPDRVPRLAEWLQGIGENARRVRALIEQDGAKAAGSGLPGYLPFNRKERYYTGTVLPMVIASSGFAHLHHFLDLCGLMDVLPDGIADRMGAVQFLTEYGFAESASYDDKWKSLASARDTPDVVIVGPDWLLAVEAKLYANQPSSLVREQMEGQQSLLDIWARKLDLPDERVRLVALFPAQYAKGITDFPFPIVTWEQVRDAYRGIAPLYWWDVLHTAVSRYKDLKSNFSAEDTLRGADILARHQKGTLNYQWVGRDGGPAGTAFQKDLATGDWRSRSYKVRVDPKEGSGNWWPISQFLFAVDQSVAPAAEE